MPSADGWIRMDDMDLEFSCQFRPTKLYILLLIVFTARAVRRDPKQRAKPGATLRRPNFELWQPQHHASCINGSAGLHAFNPPLSDGRSSFRVGFDRLNEFDWQSQRLTAPDGQLTPPRWFLCPPAGTMYKRDLAVLLISCVAILVSLQKEGSFSYRKAWCVPKGGCRRRADRARSTR